MIDRFGLIDSGPRGNTSRYSLSGQFRRGTDSSLTQVNAYAMAYDFQLFSNFTYLLDDPVRGDQIEQVDDRRVSGIDASHMRLNHVGRHHVEWTVGLQARFDDIDNALYRTQDLERFRTTRQDSVRQWGFGPYAEAAVAWTPTFRSTVGVRVDRWEASVDADLAENSGSAVDTLVSPKLALVFGPWNKTEIYASIGNGFHSNDARGVLQRVDPNTGQPAIGADPLVRALGAEVGVRTSILDGLQSTLTVFSLALDSELVFVGDAGNTEAGRPSRRVGLEWTNAWQVNRWLSAEFDATWVDAEFTDFDPAGARIPGALEAVIAGGLVVQRGPWLGALRLRMFSGYPLIEDNSERASEAVVVNARVGYTFDSGLTVHIEGFNLLDREDNDVEYFYASRLPGEPLDGIEDHHIHPVEKPSVRVGIDWRF